MSPPPIKRLKFRKNNSLENTRPLLVCNNFRGLDMETLDRNRFNSPSSYVFKVHRWDSFMQVLTYFHAFHIILAVKYFQKTWNLKKKVAYLENYRSVKSITATSMIIRFYCSRARSLVVCYLRSERNRLPLPLMSYESWMFVKETQIERKELFI